MRMPSIRCLIPRPMHAIAMCARLCAQGRKWGRSPGVRGLSLRTRPQMWTKSRRTGLVFPHKAANGDEIPAYGARLTAQVHKHGRYPAYCSASAPSRHRWTKCPDTGGSQPMRSGTQETEAYDRAWLPCRVVLSAAVCESMALTCPSYRPATAPVTSGCASSARINLLGPSM